MEQHVSRRNSIVTRLTVIVGGTLISAVLVIGGMALYEQQRQLTRALETKAATLAQFMAQVSPISVLSLNFVEMSNNVKKMVLTDDEAVYAIISNEQGVPLSYYLKESDPAVTRTALALWVERSPQDATVEMKRAGRILEVEAPIMAGGNRIGSATVGFTSELMRHALVVQTAFIGAILLIVTSLSISLLVLVLRRILQPVQALTSAATQISTGDLNIVLTGVGRRDELGVLARAFESMTTQLRGLISGMQQRMSELQDMGQALQKRENDLRQITLLQHTILANVAYGIISTTPDGTVTSFNPAAERLLGYTADELVGKRTPECWHDAEEIARHARQLSVELGETIQPGFEVFAARPRRNEPEEREWTFVCKDGRRIPVYLSVTALRDEDGRITGYVGLINDLSERKQAEAERQANLHFLESMDRVNRALQGTNDFDQMLSDVLDVVLAVFDGDRAFLLYPCDPAAASWSVPVESCKPEYPGVLKLGIEIPTSSDVAQTFRTLLDAEGPLKFGPGTEHPLPADASERFGFKCFMSMAIRPKVGSPWQFGLHQCSHVRNWTAEEERLFHEIGRRLADGLSTLLVYRDLQESEARYRRIVDTATEGIWGFGPDTRTTLVNARMANMLGYSIEEMSGRPMSDFMLEEDLPDYRKRLEGRRQGVQETYERRFRRKDGKTIWSLVSATPIINEQKQFQGSFGMFTDITERKRVEDALVFVAQRGWQASSENFFDALAQFLGEKLDMDYVLIDRISVDPEMTETVALFAKGALAPNLRYALKGTPCENVMGKSLCVYPYGVQQRFPDDPLLPGMGAESYIGLPLWDSTGRPIGLIAVMSCKPIADDAPVTQLLQLVATRVAAEMERKRAEDEIHALNQQLEQRVVERTAQLEEANNELEAFAYSVSHDLRTPLRAIDGFSKLLIDAHSRELDKEGLRLLRVVRDNTSRMAQLIDDMLQFSRTGRMEINLNEIDMNQLVQQALAQLCVDDACARVEFRIGDLPSVRGDNAMMRQVLLNLLANALKFSRGQAKPRIEVGAGVEGEEIVYHVKDNGVGFDMQYADKLFGVFQRLHSVNEFEGTGIGLAIVKRIVTRHGGRVWAEGRVGEGATIKFALPRSR